MIEVTECPICKGTDLQKFRSCKDHTVSHETFTVRVCANCTLAITSPRPDSNLLGDYYKSNEYISHSGKSSGGLGLVYRLARFLALNWKRSKIQHFKSSGSILDFGCGTGEFLQTMKSSGWNIQGLEVSDSARQKAETLNAQKFLCSLDEISGAQFDVITAWHVLEHVPDLTQTVQKLKKSSQANWRFICAVPNHQSPDAEKYQDNWAGFDVPRHLWHFSKEYDFTFELSGLKFVDTVPMKLDAYYVSMLSEKYRNNNHLTLIQLMGGFFSGIKSNFKARKETNHSSLIYIATINEG